MDTILQKIELLMFTNMIQDGHIIEDDGTYNVPMENKTNLRYSFVDDKDFGDRTLVEQKKIIFLNDVMDIFTELHGFIHENGLSSDPIYFDKKALTTKMENLLDVNTEEPLDGESCEDDSQNEVQQTLEQITTEVTDMEL
tara:strand:+ start:5210 stop:5629 length:420 start_codon:yes stop_codon:yes gene_type:complete